MEENRGLPLIKPNILPPLDPHFRPAVLANRAFKENVTKSGQGIPVHIAIEQREGAVSHYRTDVYPDHHEGEKSTFIYLERLLKFLLWSRGGKTIYFAGPPIVAGRLKQHYETSDTGIFDSRIIGQKIYDQAIDLVILKSVDQVPAESEATAPLGRHLDGCRIGFDLGASDRKAAAIVDGKSVFSEEVVWDPLNATDPEWHFSEIMNSLERAADHLPRVDAIGGSSAGVYVDNLVKVASIFRGVPDELFETGVKPIFQRLKKAWNGIPFDVVNDGEVTALAGSMAINGNGVLGIAMGSSEAAGYVNLDGNITPWLDELAFAPVDFNPLAPIDEWSGDYGCGVQYFSQQCVGRLLASAGIEVQPRLSLPEKLEHVQELMRNGDERAADIYRTIGVYLGYTIAHYADFYDFNYLLVLGRVTTGRGGEIIIDDAQHVLKTEFPDLSEKITFHVPDENEKRHGQAIAAASLPII